MTTIDSRGGGLPHVLANGAEIRSVGEIPFETGELEYYGGLLVRAEPTSESPIPLSCVDKDDPHNECSVLGGEELYLQYPGGPDGLATTYAAALEADNPGILDDLRFGVHEIGVLIADELLDLDVDVRAVFHKPCKKIESREDLTADSAEVTYEEALTIYPDINPETHGRVSAAHMAMHSSGLLVPADQVYEDLHRDTEHPIVPIARLYPSPPSNRLVIDATTRHGELWAFRRPQRDRNAYLSTMGTVIGLIHSVGKSFEKAGFPPVDRDTIRTASTTEHIALAKRVGLGRVALVAEAA